MKDMITKAKLMKHINSFPEEFSLDELIDKLVFVEKLERRIQKSKENDTIDESELESEIEKWLK